MVGPRAITGAVVFWITSRIMPHSDSGPPLLVASISEAMARSASNSQASSSRCGPLGRKASFLEGRGPLPLAWMHASAGAAEKLDLETCFKVASSRRPGQLLSFPAAADALGERLQTMARLSFLVSAQQALVQYCERRLRKRRQNGAAVDSGEHDLHQLKTQPGGTRDQRQARKLAEEALQLERAMQLEEAADLFVRAAELDPSSAEYWARASKVLSDGSFAPGATTEKIVALNKRAIELGLKAVEADPNSGFGWVACCVSRGRLAIYSDNRTKVHLARQAQDDVKRALSVEPTNDVAHHLLGRWHYEMASVNVVVRTLIQVVYGAALMAGSYKEAAVSFSRAVELRPNYLIHRVELGRTCLKLGQQERARGHLEAALDMDLPDINAVLLREDATKMLAKLGIKPAAKDTSSTSTTTTSSSSSTSSTTSSSSP